MTVQLEADVGPFRHLNPSITEAIRSKMRLPHDISRVVARHLIAIDYKNLRLACRLWDDQINALGLPRFPAIFRLPHELMLKIYEYLAPSQFNAARNTCHHWRMASFDPKILILMLKRGGWWSGIEHDQSSGALAHEFGYEIPLSRRIAHECGLLPRFPGYGLRHTLSYPRVVTHQTTALVHASITDMSDLGSVASTPRCEHGCGLTFTVSTCCRFVLVVESCTIYIYELDGPKIAPVTSIVCPKRVQAVSMDTSAQRFAVAALLDGRVGLVCDLDQDELHREPPTPSVYSDTSARPLEHVANTVHTQQVYAGIERPPLPRDAVAIPAANEPLARTQSSPTTTRRDDDDDVDVGRVQSIHVRSPHQSVSLLNASASYAGNRTWRNRVVPFQGLLDFRHSDYNFHVPNHGTVIPVFTQRGGITNRTCSNLATIPISPAALSIYNAICSPDDPPRSVAICPSRRCVAFGCEAGVELHWVDARGGRNLMKWFPLTAPSDCLFFLPNRPGIDGPNKLRLISSKTGDCQREKSVARQSRSGPLSGVRRRRLWTVWPFGVGPIDNGALDEYDHYSAIPLADGAHLLFTDPTSGYLFMGSDAPTGNATRILRKIRFIPPFEVVRPGSPPEQAMPNLYSTGVVLSHGVRVVAVYATEKIVLYTVPPDVFEDAKRIGGTGIMASHDHGDEWEFGEWSEWWPPAVGPSIPISSSQHPSSASMRPGNALPVPIHGAYIGKVKNIVEIGINNEQDDNIIVWAFTRDGEAHTWRRGRPDQHIAHRVVERNGLVVDVQEKDGDWVVRDVWGNPEDGRKEVVMRDIGEGANPNSPFVDEWFRHREFGPRDASRVVHRAGEIDEDGDTRMGGVDGTVEIDDWPVDVVGMNAQGHPVDKDGDVIMRDVDASTPHELEGELSDESDDMLTFDELPESGVNALASPRRALLLNADGNHLPISLDRPPLMRDTDTTMDDASVTYILDPRASAKIREERRIAAEYHADPTDLALASEISRLSISRDDFHDALDSLQENISRVAVSAQQPPLANDSSMSNEDFGHALATILKNIVPRDHFRAGSRMQDAQRSRYNVLCRDSPGCSRRPSSPEEQRHRATSHEGPNARSRSPPASTLRDRRDMAPANHQQAFQPSFRPSRPSTPTLLTRRLQTPSPVSDSRLVFSTVNRRISLTPRTWVIPNRTAHPSPVGDASATPKVVGRALAPPNTRRASFSSESEDEDLDLFRPRSKDTAFGGARDGRRLTSWSGAYGLGSLRGDARDVNGVQCGARRVVTCA